MQLTIVNQGLEAAHSAGSFGPKINAVTVKFGDGTLSSDLSFTDLQGTLLYTAPVTSYSVISSNLVEYYVLLDETVGDFAFTEVGLFLDTGELFAHGIVDDVSSPISKYQQNLPSTVGNRIHIKLQIQLSNITNILDFTLIESDENNEWSNNIKVATYLSGSTFKVDGDITATYKVGRRLRATIGSGFVYSYISSSVYDGFEDETFLSIEDSLLDNTLTIVDHGIINNGSETSLPKAVPVLEILGDSLKIITQKTIVASTDPGEEGQVAWDSNYLYVCVADNDWRRISLGGAF